MANNRYAFRAYQIDGPGGITGIQSPYGVYQSIPTALSTIREAPPGTTAGVNSVPILSIVKLLPTGLNKQATEFYTDLAPSVLNTAGT